MPTDGCDYEGCSLPNGFSSETTWTANGGNNVTGNPILLAQYPGDFTWEEAAYLGLGLGTVTAFPLAFPVVTDWAIRIASTACADGECWNEAQQVQRFIRQCQAYEKEVRNLLPEAQRRLAGGQSVENVAQWAHQARRALGMKYKDMMPADMLQVVTERNLRNYGDSLGPTIDFLRNVKLATWEQIIESAARPGGKDILPKLFDMVNKR